MPASKIHSQVVLKRSPLADLTVPPSPYSAPCCWTVSLSRLCSLSRRFSVRVTVCSGEIKPSFTGEQKKAIQARWLADSTDK